MILDNANVLTMDPALPHATVLAIAGGRVLGGVDSREDAIASHAHERVDLQGATVVPGFVESHCHFRAWALAQHRLRLHDSPSFEGVLDRVRMQARSTGPGADDLSLRADEAVRVESGGGTDDAWVLASGWSNPLLPASRSQLDRLHQAAEGRPFAASSRDGHALVITQAGLDRLALTLEDLPGPSELIERDGTGDFTGVLREAAGWFVRARLPEDDLTTRVLAGAMREASKRGVTSLHDVDGAAALRAWRGLELERGLSLRVWVHLLVEDLPHAEALGFGTGFGSDRLAIGGLKVFADGTMGSGTALLDEPELPLPGREPRTGVAVTDRDAIRDLARRAGMAGLPLVVHAIGDRAFADVVEALAATQEHWGHLPMRPRIEHAQLTHDEDLARCAQLGIGLSVQPAMLVTDRDEAQARWGDRTARAYAYRSMVDAGCALLLGSDAPVEELRPLAALHAVMSRDGGAHGLAGPGRGPWHPEQALDAEAALLACTAWPADATGVAHRLGRLTPGREADLVVLSGDPTQDDVASIEVVATMVGGRWTHGAATLSPR